MTVLPVAVRPGPAGWRADVRHHVETLAWRHSAHLARRLLVDDLTAVHEHRHSGRHSAFVEVEASVSSQNGEDGILAFLFSVIGPGDRRFVEIGAADGEENCTRNLAESGWSGLWLEGDPELCAHAATLAVADRLVIRQGFVEPDNVVDLLTEGGFGPGDPLDLLSIDIDGNDYWVLREVLGQRSPRAIIAEYNGAHRFGWVAPYRRGRGWDRSWDYGASLDMIAALAAAHGYVLVGCDSVGVNAVFVHERELSHLEAVPGGYRRRGMVVTRDDVPVRPELRPGTAAAHYVPPTHRPGTLGHPRTTPFAPSLPPDVYADGLAAVRMKRFAVVGGRTHAPHQWIDLVVDIHNRSPFTLSVEGNHPIHLSYRWIALDGGDVQADAELRSPLPTAVLPGLTRPAGGVARTPRREGRYLLVPTLLQEGIRWREIDAREGVVITVSARRDR